jgi:hypothetical protein
MLPSELNFTRPLGNWPAFSRSVTISAGGLGGTLTPAGNGIFWGGEKPFGGRKSGASVPPVAAGLKLAGSVGISPGVAMIGTICRFPGKTTDPSACNFMSARVPEGILVTS